MTSDHPLLGVLLRFFLLSIPRRGGRRFVLVFIHNSSLFRRQIGLLLRLLLALRLATQLIINQIVHGEDGADHGGEVDHQELVVGLRGHGIHEGGRVDVGQQIENVLEVADHVRVHRQLLPLDLFQVRDDAVQMGAQTVEPGQLVGHELRQGTYRGVLDISVGNEFPFITRYKQKDATQSTNQSIN